MSTKNFLGAKVRPASTAESSAVLVVTNIKIRTEAQHSIPLLSLQDLLQETCTFKAAVVSSIHAKEKSYEKVQKIL